MKPAGYEETFVKEARRRAGAQAEAAGAGHAPIHVRGGAAAPVISSTAKEQGADLIVVGAHPRRALTRFLVGSTAERVIRLAHRPVLVAVEARRQPFRRILAALDLSTQSEVVLETAAAIALADGAEVRALYVQEPLPPMLMEAAAFDQEEYRRQGRGQMERLLEEVALPAGVTAAGRVREGRAGHEILEEAQDWDADLVVLGTHGFGFFERLLLGSTSTHVLRHGQRATIIVPPAEEP